jgi:hypothetical protein
MIDLDNRALFPLETGYAVDLPSPLREYPPSSLHVSSSSPPAGPRPYAAPDSDSVCARQRQRQQETQGGGGVRPATHIRDKARRTAAGRALAAPAAARVSPAQLVVVCCVPVVRLTPRSPHSASVVGLAPSPHAWMSSLGHSAGLACGVGSSHRSPAPNTGLCSGYGGEDHLYHLANSWELVASRRSRYQ